MAALTLCFCSENTWSPRLLKSSEMWLSDHQAAQCSSSSLRHKRGNSSAPRNELPARAATSQAKTHLWGPAPTASAGQLCSHLGLANVRRTCQGIRVATDGTSSTQAESQARCSLTTIATCRGLGLCRSNSLTTSGNQSWGPRFQAASASPLCELQTPQLLPSTTAPFKGICKISRVSLQPCLNASDLVLPGTPHALFLVLLLSTSLAGLQLPCPILGQPRCASIPGRQFQIKF